MRCMLNEEHFVDDVDGVESAFVDDVGDGWDDEDLDDASFDEVEEDEAVEASDWPRGAVDACAPEGALRAF